MRQILRAYPMHGQHKLSNEGYRTRDGHIIEWLGRFAAAKETCVKVISRPEPVILAMRHKVHGQIAAGTISERKMTWMIPARDPKHWWVRSAGAYPEIGDDPELPVIVWNPFVAVAPKPRNPFHGGGPVALDLLDDWTIHREFASIRKDVVNAYARAFDMSNFVFANSEGTVELACRFGRSDVQLMTNGVDPGRFDCIPNAHGPLTVGYVGKIGRRLDAQLISHVCTSFPEVRFVFAGPFPDVRDQFRSLLESMPNVAVLGDVHYENVPALMATFDLGWVPHAVGDGEVGGDAIKTYEYRATGLQVLTTPIIGAGRTLSQGVHVIEARDQVDWLKAAISGRERIERVPAEIPEDLTWRYKARQMATSLGISA